MAERFIFDRARRSTRLGNEIVIQGYCSEDFLESYNIVVWQISGNHSLPLAYEKMVGGITAFARLEINDIDICHTLSLVIKLPRKMSGGDKIVVKAVSEKNGYESILIWKGNSVNVQRMLSQINVSVNSVIDNGEELIIKGWAVDSSKLEITAIRNNKRGSEIRDAAIERTERLDVLKTYPEYEGDTYVGFIIYCPYEDGKVFLKVCTCAGKRTEVRQLLWLQSDANLDLKTRLKSKYIKFHDYRLNRGNAATVRKIKKKIHSLTRARNTSYDKWIKEIIRARLNNIDDKMLQEKSLPDGYVLVTESGTRLTKDAMYQFTKLIKEKECEIVYSDNDEYVMTDSKILYNNPSFKPDFNLDLLRGYNYIGNTFVVSQRWLSDHNLQDKISSRGDKHNILLVAAEKEANIEHIPQVLYHEAKETGGSSYDRALGQEMLQAHYDRMGINAKADMISDAKDMSNTLCTGYYKTTYVVEGNPKVSIIIPNKDHIDDLEKCISSIRKNAGYENYEIIVVENNSKDKETFKFYKKLEASKDIKVIHWDKEFNFSAINNYGVDRATGEYVLLLNNDTEFKEYGCLSQLLGCCQREDVGAVGARLYYEDGTLQHAGVIIGLGGIAGHLFAGLEESNQVHQGRSLVACDYNAVTAACLMVRKEDYLKVGGLDEEFKVAFNDIDFCLKIRQLGKLVVYNPEAKLWHYESKSRGSEDTPGRMDRFLGEIERFMHKWSEILSSGDPYYNKNLTLGDTNYEVKY